MWDHDLSICSAHATPNGELDNGSYWDIGHTYQDVLAQLEGYLTFTGTGHSTPVDVKVYTVV